MHTKPRLYIETSVISYLTARPNRDLVALMRQQASRELWDARERFELCISQEVIKEIASGDPQAAETRLNLASQMTLLTGAAPIDHIVELLIARRAVPQVAYADALHIANAALYEVDFIVSWNFRHIAGAQQRHQIESVLRELGYNEITITTPTDLLEGEL